MRHILDIWRVAKSRSSWYVCWYPDRTAAAFSVITLCTSTTDQVWIVLEFACTTILEHSLHRAWARGFHTLDIWRVVKLRSSWLERKNLKYDE
jgi:hypothetical protein